MSYNGAMKKVFISVSSLFLLLAIFFGAGIVIAELFKKNPEKQIGLKTNERVAGVETESEKNPEKILAPLSTDEVVEFVESDPASSVDDPNSFSFAVLGDTQYFTPGVFGGFARASKQISLLQPNLVFAVGDLVRNCTDSGCRQDYENWKKILGPLAAKTFPMQGNHDHTNYDKADDIWRDAFNLPTNGPKGYSELVYSFDFKNSHFVVLNSNNPSFHIVNKEQRDWLERDLARNRKENVFVFFHEPAYPASPEKYGECLDKYPDERNALWDILSKYKVTGVFNGHVHMASRKKIDGIYQFGIGQTEAFSHSLPPRGAAEFAHDGQVFGIVEVKGKEIAVKTYSVDGKFLDLKMFTK